MWRWTNHIKFLNKPNTWYLVLVIFVVRQKLAPASTKPRVMIDKMLLLLPWTWYYIYTGNGARSIKMAWRSGTTRYLEPSVHLLWYDTSLKLIVNILIAETKDFLHRVYWNSHAKMSMCTCRSSIFCFSRFSLSQFLWFEEPVFVPQRLQYCSVDITWIPSIFTHHCHLLIKS